MKDISKLKDYRKKYKKYYNIEFSNKYVIHHIDMDRTNNDISNLVLLPKELHGKYHFCLDTCGVKGEKPFQRIIDGRVGGHLANNLSYEMMMLDSFFDVWYECAKWYDYKLYLEGLCPNIHNIELEK